MAAFIGGIELCRRFYHELVAPVLGSTFPAVLYTAALIGPGSEILGYDTERSTDHDWGPRLLLFLREADRAAFAEPIHAALDAALPDTFLGYPTRFARSHEERPGPPPHRVEVQSALRYFAARLGFDASVEPGPADWLVTPEQTLLELTAGAVYHDDPGELTALRARFAYYPRDIWLYRMEAQWRRIAQQEAFVGRAGDVGDEVGSAVIAATIVRDLMRLCFAIERRYAPYSKWLGTAFARLACGPAIAPPLRRVLGAPDWREREALLAEAYAAVVALHNALAITPPTETRVSRYYDRPYLVIHADGIAASLRAAIADPAVRALPLVGAADQLSDSTDFLGPAEARACLRPLYSGTHI